MKFLYKNIVRPVIFRFDSELIHTLFTHLGQQLARVYSPKLANSPQLVQEIAGIKFENPVGLSAGFDFEGRLTQILPALGFGFETIGTVTKNAYKGNPSPMLGRLPKSQSLMVNKGFKNLGANKTISNIKHLTFNIPVGMSIGSREADINDIISAFEKFEASGVNLFYYELNISCPNLQTKENFYSPKRLNELLAEIDKLQLKKPVFVKMPISKTDKEVLIILDIIAKYSPTGVILGNLQTNRQTLHPSEINKYSVGNFSGKPTFERSNELISLAYKHYKNRFVIIGCGGIFSAADAYEKITRGASLVQLITGLIFEGPQLIWEINRGLVKLLQKNGFQNISEAIGSKN